MSDVVCKTENVTDVLLNSSIYSPIQPEFHTITINEQTKTLNSKIQQKSHLCAYDANVDIIYVHDTNWLFTYEALSSQQ